MKEKDIVFTIRVERGEKTSRVIVRHSEPITNAELALSLLEVAVELFKKHQGAETTLLKNSSDSKNDPDPNSM